MSDRPGEIRAPSVAVRPELLVHLIPAHYHLSLAILFAVLCGVPLSWARIHAVWSSGAFFDTDDAMRMVQVRDWLAGQGWFDLTQYRMAPPSGVFMHWSRIVDVPLAALIRLFDLVAPPVLAERAARLVFPFALTGLLYATVVALGEMLLGRTARWTMLALAFLSGPMLGQFQPGRIDHHAPQIVLLMAATCAMALSFDPARARLAFWAAAAMALSLGVSVENLPFFAALAVAPAILWVIQGDVAAPRLIAFGAGIAVTLPAVFAATIAPSRWGIVAMDCLSLAQLSAGLAGAVIYAALAWSGWRATTLRSRLQLASLLALFAGCMLALAFPALLHEPFNALDPVLRTMWLDHVEEAQPLWRKAMRDPLDALILFAPPLFGFVGACLVAHNQAGLARQRWMFVACVLGIGLLAGFWMIRVLYTTLPLACAGALALILNLRARADAQSLWRGPAGFLLLALATSHVGLAIAGDSVRPIAALLFAKPLPALASAQSVEAKKDCLAPDNFAPFAKLAPSLVFAQIDTGSYLLAHTPHSVLAGAYHRNVTGDRLVIDALLAAPDAAYARVLSSNARYLVYCRSTNPTPFAKASPHGLDAALALQNAPSWLRRIDLPGTAFDVYDIVPPLRLKSE